MVACWLQVTGSSYCSDLAKSLSYSLTGYCVFSDINTATDYRQQYLLGRGFVDSLPRPWIPFRSVHFSGLPWLFLFRTRIVHQQCIEPIIFFRSSAMIYSRYHHRRSLHHGYIDQLVGHFADTDMTHVLFQVQDSAQSSPETSLPLAAWPIRSGNQFNFASCCNRREIESSLSP